MLEKLFSGFNVTVLAYGQTGSGKTHTMGTAFNSETTDGFLEGIIPRAVKVLNTKISYITSNMSKGSTEVHNKLDTVTTLGKG